MSLKIKRKVIFKIYMIWDWRDGSMVESTGFSFRWPSFNSQHTCGDSKHSLTPISGNLVISFSPVWTLPMHSEQTYMLVKYLQYSSKSNFLKNAHDLNIILVHINKKKIKTRGSLRDRNRKGQINVSMREVANFSINFRDEGEMFKELKPGRTSGWSLILC